MSTPSRRWLRPLGWAAFAVFATTMVVFWTWAFFIVEYEPINRINDSAWAEWAEGRCAQAQAEMDGLANFTRMEPGDADLIEQRASIIDTANGIVATMLDDLGSRSPTDEKGQILIPAWLGKYQIYLDDREAYADQLRRTQTNGLFVESLTEEGIPNSELLETFANDNYMPSCAPKKDLS